MKKILIIRPDGIGDFIIFSAVLEHYARLFPGYRMDLLCHHKVRDVAATIPYFSRIFCVDQFQMHRPGYLPRLLKNTLFLSLNHYEKVICPVYSRNREIDFMVRLIGAREKIGFDGNASNDPDGARLARNAWYTRIITSDPAPKKEIERNLEFVEKLGAKQAGQPLATKMWLSPQDERVARETLLAHGLEAGKYVCIFPGAGFPIRYWNDSSWVALIEQINANHSDLKIVLLGFGRDIEPITAIESGLRRDLKDQVVNLYGKTPIRIMAKVIELSRLCITLETGTVHIAAALRTPSVCILGGGHFGRFYPYGDERINRFVCRKMDCYGCDWRCIYETARCIKEIPVADVLREAEALLNIPSTQRS